MDVGVEGGSVRVCAVDVGYNDFCDWVLAEAVVTGDPCKRLDHGDIWTIAVRSCSKNQARTKDP